MTTTLKIQPAAAVTWAASGGDKTLTLTSLADEAARQGESLDLGAAFAETFGYRLKTKYGSLPLDGALLRIALAFSDDNTVFAAGATGSDAAYSETDDFRNAMELRPLVLRETSDAQIVVGSFQPVGRYVAPIVFNDAAGDALSSTAGDHELVIWPLVGVAE